MRAARKVDLVKHYAGGIGRIEGRGLVYLVSFYGRRVAQEEATTMAEARRIMSRLAKEWSR